jgi:YD repeat-containing protein
MTKEIKPRGNGFTYTYDSKGNMTEKRMKADTSAANSGNDLVTTYVYDLNNNLLTQTNPNSIVIANTYDSNNNLLTKTLSGATTYSGTVQNTTTSYTYLSGFLDTATDGEGNITKFQYSSGQVSKIIRGTGSVTSTGSFTYDSYGNPTASTNGEGWTKSGTYNLFNLLGTGTTAEGVVTSYEYDANNNKTKETRYLSGGTAVKSQFFYDILDHMTGSLVDTASGKTLLTTFKYDENGNIIEKKVGSGALVKYTYNEFGKVESERVIMNSGDSSQDIVTGYSYDTNGNLTAKTDPLGNTTTYTYDLYDRATQETNPKGTYVIYAFNKDGSVSSKSVYDSGSTILSKSAYLSDGLGNIVKSTDYLTPASST